MKRLFFSMFFCLAVVLTAAAQITDFMAPLPNDPAVRYGQLENGLTYYIRHNAIPENQADFFIYNDVGAIQEEDSQAGLAHFLEHMAFNGTKNLPGNTLIDYLETVGVKFGMNLNAGTGQDMTVYMMQSVPTVREGVVDTCLMILHDWAYYITVDPEEMEKERGVIIEELRTGNDANFRVREAYSPALYNNSKYAYRNIIGDEQQLRTFDRQELMDFYHRWYRTDLQALVIVGDIDVDDVERKIIAMMSEIPAVEDPMPKEYFPIPGNTEPVAFVATDPELTVSSILYLVRREAIPHELNNTLYIRKLNTLLDFVTRILNFRLEDIVNQNDAPFIMARTLNGSLTQSNDVVQIQAIARDGETEKAFEAVYAEIEKVRRFGFTVSEFERAKDVYYRNAESRYDGRNDRRNGEYVWELIGHFSSNKPYLDAETRWEIDSMLISTTSLMEVNMIAQQIFTSENQTVIVTSPEKEDVYVPTSETILAVMEKVENQELEAYEESGEKLPLIDKELTGSPVVETSADMFGNTIWTLGNGAEVIIKRTDFKADEVVMSVNSKGGLSILSDEDYMAGSLIEDLVGYSGLSQFNAVELSKQLAGKVASVNPDIKEYENGFSGRASVKDFETMLQLLYLRFTDPRFSREDFERMVDQYTSFLKNRESNPDYIFQKALFETIYDGNLRRNIITADILAGINYDRMPQIYEQLYANADDFKFIFVGNIDPEEVRPMIEKYIGSLPSTEEKFTSVDDGVRPISGQVDKKFEVAMQTPKASVAYIYTGPIEKYDQQTRMTFNALSQILNIRYTESIREEKGGTYGVGVIQNVEDDPIPHYTMLVVFDTDPEMVDELVEIVEDEIRMIAENGPKQEDLNKIIEFWVKQRQDDLKKNNIWLDIVDSYYINEIDKYTDYDEIVRTMSVDKLQALAAKIISDGNLAKVVMLPERQ